MSTFNTPIDWATCSAERQAELLALARQDARLLLDQDPELTGPRGQAVRTLLWLMEQDRAIGLMSAG